MNTDFLKSCHQELSAELAAARAALSALQAEDATAVEAAVAAARVLREARAAIAAILRPSSLITGRLRELEAAQSAASGRQVRAAGCLKASRERIQELESALRQLDQVLNQVVEDAA